MPTNKENIEQLEQGWNRIITREKGLALNLSELELSALQTWVIDCFESFDEIYFDLLEKIKDANPDDYDLIHDCVVDIYWALDHIKNHVKDAEKGLLELMSVLAQKADNEQKK